MSSSKRWLPFVNNRPALNLIFNVALEGTVDWLGKKNPKIKESKNLQVISYDALKPDRMAHFLQTNENGRETNIKIKIRK